MRPRLEDFRSNVAVVEREEVRRGNFDELVPLVIRGAMTRATEKWTDRWLVRQFGEGSHQVSLDSRPAVKQYKKQVSLPEYLEALASPGRSAQHPEYLFQTWLERHFEGARDLLDDLDVPPPILRLGVAGKWRLFVGPSLSGTLPHHHRSAINALARGRKRWAIYAGRGPARTARLLDEGYRGYESGAQARDWFLRELPTLRSRPDVRLWELAQEPGDLVYIPGGYIHAIVNLEPVVGFGAELFPTSEDAGVRPPVRGPQPMRRRGPARRGRRVAW
jgi:hypothetical protein